MHLTPLLQLAAAAALCATRATSATDWAFTFYDAEGCSGDANPSTAVAVAAASVPVNGTGDVECAVVPGGGGRTFGSVQGAIPADGSGCAVHLFTDEECGSRLAYGLTEKTNECMSLADTAVPLRSYQALSCG